MKKLCAAITRCRCYGPPLLDGHATNVEDNLDVSVGYVNSRRVDSSSAASSTQRSLARGFSATLQYGACSSQLEQLQATSYSYRERGFSDVRSTSRTMRRVAGVWQVGRGGDTKLPPGDRCDLTGRAAPPLSGHARFKATRKSQHRLERKDPTVCQPASGITIQSALPSGTASNSRDDPAQEKAASLSLRRPSRRGSGRRWKSSRRQVLDTEAPDAKPARKHLRARGYTLPSLARPRDIRGCCSSAGIPRDQRGACGRKNAHPALQAPAGNYPLIAERASVFDETTAFDLINALIRNIRKGPSLLMSQPCAVPAPTAR